MSFLVRFAGSAGPPGGSQTLPVGGSQKLPIGGGQTLQRTGQPGISQTLPAFGSVQACSASVSLPIMGASVQTQRGRGGKPRTLEKDLETMGSAGFEAAFAQAFGAHRLAEMNAHPSSSPGPSIQVLALAPASSPVGAPVSSPVGSAVPGASPVGGAVAVPTASGPPGPTEGQQIGAPDGIRSNPANHDISSSWPMSGGRRTATPMATAADRGRMTVHARLTGSLQAPKVMRKSSQTRRETMHVTSRRNQTPTPVVMRRSVGDRVVLNVNVAAAKAEQGIAGSTSSDGLTFRPSLRERCSVSPSPMGKAGPSSVLCSPPAVNRSPGPSTRATRTHTAAEVIAQLIDPTRASREEVELQTPKYRAQSAMTPTAVTRSPPASTRDTRLLAEQLQIAMHSQVNRSQHSANRSPISSFIPAASLPPPVNRSPAPSMRSTRNGADQVAAQSQLQRASDNEVGQAQQDSDTQPSDSLASSSQAQAAPADALSENPFPQTPVLQPRERSEGPWLNSEKHCDVALVDFLSSVLAPTPTKRTGTPQQTPQATPRQRSLSMRSPNKRSPTPRQTPKITPRLGNRETSRKTLPREASGNAIVRTLMEVRRASSRSASAGGERMGSLVPQAMPLSAASPGPSRSPAPQRSTAPGRSLGSPAPRRSPGPQRQTSSGVQRLSSSGTRRQTSSSPPPPAQTPSSPPEQTPSSSPPPPSETPAASLRQPSQSGTPAPSEAGDFGSSQASLIGSLVASPPVANTFSVPDAVQRPPTPIQVSSASFPVTERELSQVWRAESPSPTPTPSAKVWRAESPAAQTRSTSFVRMASPSPTPTPTSSFYPEAHSFLSMSSSANPDDKVVPPKVLQMPSARRHNTERRYSEGDAASSRSLSRSHQLVVATSGSVAADPNHDGLETIIRAGDVLCVNGVRGINAMARLGANGGFMGHVLLAAGEPQPIVKDTPQAIQYVAAWPDEAVPKIWLVPTVESTRIEEGLHETIHLLYIEPSTGYIRLGGEERTDMIVRYQDSGSSSVEVWQSPPELRSQLRPDLFSEALADLRVHQGSWSWSTAVRAFLMSAEVSEHTDPQITMEQIQDAWRAEPICTSVVLSCWQRYLCKIATSCASSAASFPSMGDMEPPADALGLILMWMPMRADRTLPGELLRLLQSKGWTSLKQATKQNPAAEGEGGFVRTNSF